MQYLILCFRLFIVNEIQVHVKRKEHHVDDMAPKSKEMDVFGVLVPLKVQQVLHRKRIKNL